MTIHSSKGTEFRAVHIFKAEDLNHYPLNRTRVSYTAVTRARTALNVYRSAETNRNLESAMSEPKCSILMTYSQVTYEKYRGS